MTSPDEAVQVIGRAPGHDLELDVLVDRQFSIEWWRDQERTIPIPFASVQLGCASEGTFIFHEGTAGVTLTIRPDETNICDVLIEKSVAVGIGVTQDWTLTWFFQGTGEADPDQIPVVMVVRGRARVV